LVRQRNTQAMERIGLLVQDLMPACSILSDPCFVKTEIVGV